MLCGKFGGADLDDYFIFDTPVGGHTFALDRAVKESQARGFLQTAKGRTIRACYGCVADMLWRRQASTEVATLERVLAAIGGCSVLPSARTVIERMLTEARGRIERDQTLHPNTIAVVKAKKP